MKLAVLSDIHGNWPALEATVAAIDAWRPDLVVVDGDVVNDGPSSPACWDYISGRRNRDGWVVLRGNHEEYVAEWLDPATPREGPAYDLIRLSHWTFKQLNGTVDELAALPERWDWSAPDGATVVVMHGTMLGNRAGIYPFTSDESVRSRLAAGARVFVTAHTHVPHRRFLDGTQLINIGSVGVPGDGDGRAAYGRITWTKTQGWQAAIARVRFDRAAAEHDYFTSGFMDEAGPEAELSLVQYRMARDVRTRWSAEYRQAILAGDISLARSLCIFLDQAEFRPYWATSGREKGRPGAGKPL
jgi:predicted phosphodiesterase